MIYGFFIFHLNLAFSSISEESRSSVIQKSYWPLLRLIENSSISAGIELSGWTLDQIYNFDKSWVAKFKELIVLKKCELIGSGWSQLIGPLVPNELNRWNQHLGLKAYKKFLGLQPSIALVNEMAFSTSMVDLYKSFGYEALVMDRDNIRLALDIDTDKKIPTPNYAQGTESNNIIPILWSDSILFQRFQRLIHGEITYSDYSELIKSRIEKQEYLLPIYTNDAEVFDFRPGRFSNEANIHFDGEWVRIEKIIHKLRDEFEIKWISPSEAIKLQCKDSLEEKPAFLTSAKYPIPVKKQAKYNINRWAISGRDDLWLNTLCHQICKNLIKNKISDEEKWRELSEFWASDYRTHITDKRWSALKNSLSHYHFQHQTTCSEKYDNFFNFINSSNQQVIAFNSFSIDKGFDGQYFKIKTKNIEIVLNAKRGFTINSLSFKSQDFIPIILTIPQGYFDSITMGADFYSGGVFIEVPGEEIQRITDLDSSRQDALFTVNEKNITFKINIPFFNGSLIKTIEIDLIDEKIVLGYKFSNASFPVCIARVSSITFNPDLLSRNISLLCKNGGDNYEKFEINRDLDHSSPVSTFVSSTSGFGATNGVLIINVDKNLSLKISWDPSKCSAIPLLKFKKFSNKNFMRIVFSLSEVDDTSKKGKIVPPFFTEISPHCKEND